MTFSLKKYLMCFFIVFISLQIQAQDADSTENNGSGMFFYPFVFYTPETQFAFGGGGIIFFRNDLDKSSRPSKIVPSVYYTTNSQFSIDIVSEIYFLSNNYFAAIELGAGKYLRKYYGIGSDTEEIETPNYKEYKFQASISGYKNISQKVKLGLVYEIEYHNIYDKMENPYLLDEVSYGSEGGLTSGIGYAALFDTRDNTFYPTLGGFYEFEGTFFSKAFGSDYDFNRYLINLRRYFPVFGDKVLAFQAYGNFVNGYPPFYGLPELGGQNVMRGYFEGRYRDRKYFSFQAELRTTIFWRIGLVGFLGLGDVQGRFPDFKLTKLKYSYGLGVRFTIDTKEKLDVRCDVGFGKNTAGVYFGIEQAF